MKRSLHIGMSVFLSSATLFAIVEPSGAQEAFPADVIRVDSLRVSAAEFSARLNATPAVFVKYSPKSRNEGLAASLVTEKILALEARRMKMDTAREMIATSNEIEKEAVYEQWMENEVGAKATFTSGEVKQAYGRFVEQRIVDVVACFDSLTAARVRDMLVRGEELAATTDVSGVKGSERKALEYGESLEAVEDAVWGLPPGGVTGILRLDDAFYVFRLVKKGPHPEYSKRDRAYWQKSVEKRLKERKEAAQLAQAMDAIMVGKSFTVDRATQEEVIRALSNELPTEREAALSGAERNPEIGLRAPSLDALSEEPFVKFQDGTVWSVGEFREKLRRSPYVGDIATQEHLRKYFSHTLRMLVIFETVAAKGRQEKLDRTIYVTSQKQMWEDYALASAYRRAMRDSLHVTAEEIQARYNARKNEWTVPERRRILELLVEGRPKAEDALRRIRSGEDLSNLVRTTSIRPTREDDAKRGRFLSKDEWGKIGEDAFRMSVGDLSGVIALDSNRFSVFRLEEIVPATPRSLEEMRGTVRAEILAEKLDAATARIVNENRARHRVFVDMKAIARIPSGSSPTMIRKSHFPSRLAVPQTLPVNLTAGWLKNDEKK